MTEAPEIGVACSRCDDQLVIARDGVRDPDHPARFMHGRHRYNPPTTKADGSPLTTDDVAVEAPEEVVGYIDPCPYGAIGGDECSMIRERSVAGVSDTIPACPVHRDVIR